MQKSVVKIAEKFLKHHSSEGWLWNREQNSYLWKRIINGLLS